MKPYRDQGPPPPSPARAPVTMATTSLVDRKTLVGGLLTAAISAILSTLECSVRGGLDATLVAWIALVTATIVTVTGVCAVVRSEGFAAWRRERAMRLANAAIDGTRVEATPEPRVRVASEASSTLDETLDETLAPEESADEERGLARRARSG